MSKLACLFGLHKWNIWYTGLQPLTDDMSKQETRKCDNCGKYQFRRVNW